MIFNYKITDRPQEIKLNSIVLSRVDGIFAIETKGGIYELDDEIPLLELASQLLNWVKRDISFSKKEIFKFWSSEHEDDGEAILAFNYDSRGFWLVNSDWYVSRLIIKIDEFSLRKAVMEFIKKFESELFSECDCSLEDFAQFYLMSCPHVR